MKLSAKSFFLICIFLAAAQPLHVWASGLNQTLKIYDLKSVDLLGQMRFFQTTGNLTKSGNSYDTLPSGYSHQIFQFDGGARGALSSSMAVFANLTLGSAQSGAPSSDTRKNTNISDLQAGGDFQFYQNGSFSLNTEISATVVTEENDLNSDATSISDGVNSFETKFIAQNIGGFFSWAGRGGIHYKDRGLATLFTYGALAEFNFKRSQLGSFWGAELNGYFPILKDSGESETKRNTYFCRANGCSKKFMAFDPSLTEITAHWRWRPSTTWELKTSFGSTITGQNAAYGYQGAILLTYHIPSTPAVEEYEETARPINTAPRKIPQRVTEPNFEEVTDDGVDQTLFQPAKPPAPAPTPPAAKATEKTQEQIRNALDKTEMQIELKSSKKRRRSR